MEYIINGFSEALKMIISFDAALYNVIGISLMVSYSASFLSAVIFIPVGIIMGAKVYKHKNILSSVLYSFMSIPTVVIGLIVALIFSRNGPMGFLNMMYTPQIMVLAQFILVAPLLLSLSFSLAQQRAKKIMLISKSIGAGRLRTIFMLLTYFRLDIIVIFITAFSRAISEVGTVMIVGGNIEGYTRVMTTAIALLNSQGEYVKAIALGIILIVISIVNSLAISMLKNKSLYET